MSYNRSRCSQESRSTSWWDPQWILPPYRSYLLLQTLELTDGLDMPDQSRARLHKAIGAVLSESNPASALNHLNHALQLDPRCGVTQDKQQLERRLRNDSR